MLEQAKEAIEAAKTRIQTPERKDGLNSNTMQQWVGWIVIALGFGGLVVFVALPFLPKGIQQETTQGNPLEIPTSRLFGFWEDRKRPGVDYWIARINQVEGNRFRIKWNGGPQRDGAGSGVGTGAGVIQSNGSVRIELAEELKADPTRQPLIVLPGMSDGPKQQSFVLEGRYYRAPGGRSYFQGDYLERGSKFYPFTRWVLETELPSGWTPPVGTK